MSAESIMRSSSINGSHSSDYAHLRQAPGARSVHRRQVRINSRRGASLRESALLEERRLRMKELILLLLVAAYIFTFC